jgi:hypothetical protein
VPLVLRLWQYDAIGLGALFHYTVPHLEDLRLYGDDILAPQPWISPPTLSGWGAPSPVWPREREREREGAVRASMLGPLGLFVDRCCAGLRTLALHTRVTGPRAAWRRLFANLPPSLRRLDLQLVYAHDVEDSDWWPSGATAVTAPPVLSNIHITLDCPGDCGIVGQCAQWLQHVPSPGRGPALWGGVAGGPGATQVELRWVTRVRGAALPIAEASDWLCAPCKPSLTRLVAEFTSLEGVWTAGYQRRLAARVVVPRARGAAARRHGVGVAPRAGL